MMGTIMNIKDDIHAVHHTFLYKNNGQMSASQKTRIAMLSTRDHRWSGSLTATKLIPTQTAASLTTQTVGLLTRGILLVRLDGLFM